MNNAKDMSKQKSTIKVCEDCGAINYDGVVYCQDCGESLYDFEYIFCEICGTKNSINNKVCHECKIIL